MQHYLADPQVRQAAWRGRLAPPASQPQPNRGHPTLAEGAKQHGVGQVLVKPLPVHTILYAGYKVWRKLMRDDPAERKERTHQANLAAQFSDMGLLPQHSVGVDGKPTQKGVSAFVCEGLAGR